MANEENLRNGESTQYRSGEEAARNGKKGGQASGKSRRRKKLLKDTVNMLLALPLKDGKLDKLTDMQTINGKNITVEEAMVLKQIQKALKGDLRAFESLVDLSGSHNSKVEEAQKPGTDNTFINALNGKAAEAWNDGDTEAE